MMCSLVRIDLGEMKMMNLSGLGGEVCVIIFKRFESVSEWILR